MTSLNGKPRFALALLLVAALALILTFALSSGEPARAMFQDSPLESPTPDFFETLTPAVIEEPPTLEPPTAVPLLPTIGPTATPKGFLPAPTIVNPDDLGSLQLAQPQVSGGGAAFEPTPTPRTPAANSGVRTFVALLNTLWLLCGGLLLIGGVAASLYIWRRSQRS